jgi:FSR family fosmidomycin resistance protein-like MFS transporter
MPHVGLEATLVLSFVIGIIIASAFSAIIVYAQELIPNKPGMVAGLFFGLAFGMGGLGAAVLGKLADTHGIHYVITRVHGCLRWGFTIFLPNTLTTNTTHK